MPSSVSDVQDHLGYWLRLVSNHVSGAFAVKLRVQGVSVAEWVVLRLLYDSDQAPSTLATAIGLSRGAVTKISDKLIERSLVRKSVGTEDGRSRMLRITPEGKRLVPVLASLADKTTQLFSAR